MDGTLPFNPAEFVFPGHAKCMHKYFGGSLYGKGSLQTMDALCTLPENNLNRVLFLFLWIFLAISLIQFILTFLFRLLILLFSCKRGWFLEKLYCRILTKELQFADLNFLCRSYGDYLVLTMLASTLDTLQMNEILLNVKTNLIEDANAKKAKADEVRDAAIAAAQAFFELELLAKTSPKELNEAKAKSEAAGEKSRQASLERNEALRKAAGLVRKEKSP